MRHKVDRHRRADHWVYLDRWWAQRLGVRRTAGVYRIRSRELARQLSQETLWVDTSGTVHTHGRSASVRGNGTAPEGVPTRARH